MNVECPKCHAGRLIWTTDIYRWCCDTCENTQALVHWLTPGLTRWFHTQPDTFGDDPEYIERFDVISERFWFQRVM
jgi:hypothetical protein